MFQAGSIKFILQLFVTFFFLTRKFLLQLLSSIAKKVKVQFENHALKLFQYSSVLFDDRFELNSNLKAIVAMTQLNITPEPHTKLLNCQATSHSVERRFSMLRKLLAKNLYFWPDNVWKYLALFVYKSLG